MSTTYVGTDLEAMIFAENYHRWIIDIFRPFLGKNLVEVGAGTGSFSEFLVQKKPESLDLIEPSEMADILRTRIADPEKINVRIYQSLFRDVADEIAKNAPDSIIYVNVLEHIEDDVQELKAVYETLSEKGRVLVFVPAHAWLYGPFDRSIGHYRRYEKKDLEKKCQETGFRIVLSRYMDFAGIIPWWIKYRLLKSSRLDARSVALYDKYCVPITRQIENLITLPTGKNIALVAEKP